MASRHDWKFDRNLENAEKLLEQRLLGWSFRRTHTIQCPFNLQLIVDIVLRKMKAPNAFLCDKPQPTISDPVAAKRVYGPEMILAMRRLGPYYGHLHMVMSQKWSEFYPDGSM